MKSHVRISSKIKTTMTMMTMMIDENISEKEKENKR